jgi:hypothetical protein
MVADLEPAGGACQARVAVPGHWLAVQCHAQAPGVLQAVGNRHELVDKVQQLSEERVLGQNVPLKSPPLQLDRHNNWLGGTKISMRRWHVSGYSRRVTQSSTGPRRRTECYRVIPADYR